MDKVKQDIASLYTALTSKNLPPKIVNYWAGSIMNNAKTMQDFENYVVNMDDYKQYILEKFKNTFYTISYDFQMSDFDDFWSRVKGSVVSDSAIYEHIVSLPVFTAKYSDVINRLYDAIVGSVCPETVLNEFLQKFKTDASYSIDRLQNDIEALVSKSNVVVDEKEAIEGEPTTPATQVIQPVGPTLADCVELMDDTEKNLFAGAFESPSTLVEYLREQKVRNEQPSQVIQLDVEFIQAFERVFERSMFVHEFFKYKEAFVDLSALPEIRKQHVSNYHRYKMIYNNYLDQKITEYEYVQRCIFDVDKLDFFTQLIDFIIDSEEYETTMKRNLSTRYMDMYGVHMDDYDLTYVFRQVKSRKMSLTDEEVRDVLVRFKDETDDIISRILKTFMDVLERQPDEMEVDKYIRFYRERISDGLDAVDSLVQRELIVSLEFHDILKKQIRSVYTRMKGTDIIPSLLFKALSNILSNIENVTLEMVVPLIEKSFS